jgi:hypothetical protein
MKRQYLLTSASMHMVENPYTILGFTFIEFVFCIYNFFESLSGGVLFNPPSPPVH